LEILTGEIIEGLSRSSHPSLAEQEETGLSVSELSLRAGGWGFSPATTSLGPGYFDAKQKCWKEKNASNYRIMN